MNRRPTLVPNLHGVDWDISVIKAIVNPASRFSGQIDPVCPDDHTPLSYNKSHLATVASCPDCHKQFDFKPLTIDTIQREIGRKYAKLINQKADFIDLDGQLTPVTQPRRIKIDERFTLEVKVNRSRRGGHQAVIYIFDKEQKNKVQLLIDTDFQKLNFDQTNLDPRSLLAKVEVMFKDGSKSIIKK